MNGMTREEALQLLSTLLYLLQRPTPDKYSVNGIRAALDALTTPAAPSAEATYPCRECGVPRTKAEGGTTFTVCDECWDNKAHHKAPTTAASFEEAVTTFGRLCAAHDNDRVNAARQHVVDEYKRVEQDVNTWTDRFNHAMRLVAKAEAEAARLRESHCKDCCCARIWAAMGITEYTGMSIVDHVEKLVAEAARVKASLKQYGSHRHGCAIRVVNGIEEACTCGWLAALADVKP